MSPPSSTADAAIGRGGAALIALFFVSGAASLVYEAVWNRLLVLQMGNTAYALTTILTVFMGGLALGSVIGGRVAWRLRDPLRTYGLLELGIGLYCALVPSFIDALEPIMRFVYNGYFGSLAAFSFFQFLACGAVLLLPVTAMGATLPIVTDFVARRAGGVSASVGLAYGINTFGGFVGVLVGGLLLVPALGLETANLVAASLSASAGLAALGFARWLGSPAGSDAPDASAAVARGPDDSPIPTPLLLGALAASGFAAMTYQVAWTRVITLSIGSVTYSFPLNVGAFIGGLAVGAALLGRFGDRPGVGTPLLVGCQLGIAIVAATTIPTLGDLPVRMTLTVLRHSDSFAALQLAKFGAVFAVVFAPTFLMGGMLPLAVRSIAQRDRGGVGAAVGRAYASNTLGTIAGSFLAGFVLVPTLGMQTTIAVAVAVNALVGAVLLLFSGLLAPIPGALAAVAAAGLISFGAFTSPDWDRQIITSAPYLHAPLYASGPAADEQEVRRSLEKKASIVYYREDVATTVTVLNDGRNRYLYVGGKLDALSRSPSQSLLGHLPMLLHERPERVLVVGLGSSETLASTLRHGAAREVDCIEISPAVVEAAGRFFQRARQPLADPRVALRIGDGRVHMAMTDRRYDVIVSQPGNPWMAGASALFTREFFQQMKDRLAPGGVVSVWVQGFSASPESVNALIGTFASVFEYADLWETRVLGDYILTGYDTPRQFDLAALDARMREPAVAAGLEWQSIEDAADLVGYFVADGSTARQLPGAGEINIDDHNFLETRLQRELLLRREADVLASLTAVGVDPFSRLAGATGGAPELAGRLERIFESKALVREAWAARSEAERLDEAGDIVEALAADRRYLALLERSRALNPRDSLLGR
jgi:spermidine synthase